MGGGNLSLASAETLVTLAERSGSACSGCRSQPHAARHHCERGRLAALLLMALLAGGLALALWRSSWAPISGLAMRAAGNNPQMAKAVGHRRGRAWSCSASALSNGLIALSGALLAQYEGFANIQMGIGAMVTGAGEPHGRRDAAGEATRSGAGSRARSLGAVVFRLLVAAALRAGLSPNALKLVTALFVLAVLVLPQLVRARRRPAPGGGAERRA